MGKVILASLLSAVVLFIWGSISWMALPWHNATLKKFSDEASVQSMIAAQAAESGVYILPNAYAREPGVTAEQAKAAADMSMSLYEKGPSLFVVVGPTGMGGMGPYMARNFVINAVAALVVVLLLRSAGVGSYGGRVLFVIGVGACGAIFSHFPYWNWWHFDTGYTLVMVADALIGWLLVGLLLAKLIRTGEGAVR